MRRITKYLYPFVHKRFYRHTPLFMMITHYKALKNATQGEDYTKRRNGAKKKRNSQSRKTTVYIAFELGQILCSGES